MRGRKRGRKRWRKERKKERQRDRKKEREKESGGKKKGKTIRMELKTTWRKYDGKIENGKLKWKLLNQEVS